MIRVDGQPHSWHGGLILADLMARVDPEGQIAVVRLNGRLVSRPNFGSTPVPDGADLRLIPLVAGG